MEACEVAAKLVFERVCQIRKLQIEITQIMEIAEFEHARGCAASTCDGPCTCPRFDGLNYAIGK